jgi:hypothetical protein
VGRTRIYTVVHRTLSLAFRLPLPRGQHRVAEDCPGGSWRARAAII